jgi:hypothetical protein
MGISDVVHGDGLPRTGENLWCREGPKLSPNSLERQKEAEL